MSIETLDETNINQNLCQMVDLKAFTDNLWKLFKLQVEQLLTDKCFKLCIVKVLQNWFETSTNWCVFAYEVKLGLDWPIFERNYFCYLNPYYYQIHFMGSTGSGFFCFNHLGLWRQNWKTDAKAVVLNACTNIHYFTKIKYLLLFFTSSRRPS